MKASMLMARARASLILSQPFFGALALKMKVEESRAVDTLVTNGKTILYNPEFVESLTGDHLKTIVAHEVMHVALMHHTRRGERDPKVWNIAGDHAVNLLLEKAGFTMPKDALMDARFADQSAEQIYEQVKPPEPPSGGEGGEDDQNDKQSSESKDNQQGESDDNSGNDKGSGTGEGSGQDDAQAGGSDSNDDSSSGSNDNQSGGGDPGGMGEVQDAPSKTGSLSEAEQAQVEREMEVAVAQAAQAAKAAGKLPGWLDRLIKASREPKIDWREELREFVSHTLKNDYAWTPPNRRHVYQGLYLPSARSDEVGPIVVAVDTSGSVSEKELQQFADEIHDISQSVMPERVWVVYCDSTVKHYEEFEYGDEIEQLEAQGGGGTRFAPVFNWVDEMGIVPQCLVYLTDMMNSDDSALSMISPDYPVLWVNTYKHQKTHDVFFGDVINLEL